MNKIATLGVAIPYFYNLSSINHLSRLILLIFAPKVLNKTYATHRFLDNPSKKWELIMFFRFNFVPLWPNGLVLLT